MQPIIAAAIQFNHRPGDKAFNLDRVRQLAAEAAEQNVNLAVFPEMCLTGYWHVRNLSRDQILQLAEPITDSPSTRAHVFG